MIALFLISTYIFTVIHNGRAMKTRTQYRLLRADRKLWVSRQKECNALAREELGDVRLLRGKLRSRQGSVEKK
jgi:hypothetical protein